MDLDLGGAGLEVHRRDRFVFGAVHLERRNRRVIFRRRAARRRGRAGRDRGEAVAPGVRREVLAEVDGREAAHRLAVRVDAIRVAAKVSNHALDHFRHVCGVVERRLRGAIGGVSREFAGVGIRGEDAAIAASGDLRRVAGVLAVPRRAVRARGFARVFAGRRLVGAEADDVPAGHEEVAVGIGFDDARVARGVWDTHVGRALRHDDEEVRRLAILVLVEPRPAELGVHGHVVTVNVEQHR
mmetsp:Transcript_6794/g.21404  ORF Transcript_6794/g.21404 Transcript_6794/m.21404 type:complete len:241 (+) Transcript_6794:649-1371(+)